MKKIFLKMLSLGLISFGSTAFAHPHGGQGSDRVEALFLRAHEHAIAKVGQIKLEEIDQLNLRPAFKTWLKDSVEGTRLGKLQYAISQMKLSFQEGPCLDPEGPRGACYDNSRPAEPRVIISYSYNQKTTHEEAMIMLIHEAGHFTGEKNHIFLSEFGAELLSVVFPAPPKNPGLLPQIKTGIYKAENTVCALVIDFIDLKSEKIYLRIVDAPIGNSHCSQYLQGEVLAVRFSQTESYLNQGYQYCGVDAHLTLLDEKRIYLHALGDRLCHGGLPPEFKRVMAYESR